MAPRTILILLTTMLTGCATLVSCDDKAGAMVEPVKIKNTWFHLEIAANDAVRIKGLGDRDYIAPDGGMIFAFPTAHVMNFVMRDCLVPIDIAFLDAAGRVVAIHEMTVEEPQRDGESDNDYEARLTLYSSRFPAVFAVETAGGVMKPLGLKEGDKIDFDARKLKRLAR